MSVGESFDAGQVFAKDDVLLKIDSRDYELALTQAKSQVAQAELRLQMEINEVDVVRREWRLLNQGDFTDYDRERDEVIYTNMVLINIVDHTTDRFDRGSILLPEDDVANFEYERVRHGNLSAMKRDWSTLEVEPIEIPPDDFD